MTTKWHTIIAKGKTGKNEHEETKINRKDAKPLLRGHKMSTKKHLIKQCIILGAYIAERRLLTGKYTVKDDVMGKIQRPSETLWQFLRGCVDTKLRPKYSSFHDLLKKIAKYLAASLCTWLVTCCFDVTVGHEASCYIISQGTTLLLVLQNTQSDSDNPVIRWHVKLH